MIGNVKYQYWLVSILFIALLIYLAMRSFLLPIQHDEVATFYFYIQTGSFLPPAAHWDANNHVLNSFLSYLSYRMLGDEPWVLRLPNVLSFILFFWSAWGIARYLNKTYVRWGFFLALVMSHYLFEFFGQTRGYGISIALLLAALWLFLRFFQTQKTLLLVAIVVVCSLATASNLTLLIPSLLLIAYVLIVYGMGKGIHKQTFLMAGFTAVLTLLLFTPLVWFSFALKKGGALYYGGTSSFWEHTGSSLSLYFTGYYAPWMAYIYTGLFLALLAGFFTILWKIKKIRIVVTQFPSFVFAWLLVGSVAAIFALRYILNVNFPEDRAAVYLFPFLIGSITFLINDMEVINRKNYSLLMLPLFFFPVHFLLKINTSTTTFPMEENPPKEFFDSVTRSEPTIKGYPVTVGGYPMQRLCWSYMNYRSGGKQSEMLVSSFIDTLCDFQIIDVKWALPGNFDQLYTVQNKETINNLNLYKRKQQLSYALITQKDSVTNWNHSDGEFFDLLHYQVPDSLRGKSLFAGLNASIDAHQAPFVAAIVISQKDADGNELSQESINLNWLKSTWNSQTDNLNQGKIIPVVNEKTAQIVIYLWNLKNNTFLIQKGKVELFVLE